MEAKSASITPTAAAAVAAPPPTLLTEEGAIVEGSVTPIELLAEATELAREALAHHAKAHQHQHQHQTHSHASNPADSPAAQHANDTAVAAPTAITTVVTPPAQIEKPHVQIHDPVPNAAGNAVAAVESKVGTTPLSTVREEQRPKDTTPPTTTTTTTQQQQQQKEVKTPVAQPAVAATTPPSGMAVSPAVATTPHPSYGNKRTASGAIKAPSQSLPATPYQPSSASPRNGRERIGEVLSHVLAV
ncbi:hypothetical protein H072_9916 [Dactylellina haptotyla CBS 200.50]|uniref:Uncharacterized protein n=1 Tax=Dactylellina haptotyla (strain CBS 200.50) TaxID=1284197 RepID=S8BMW2_DACHA|nr:hypothetical protein H072_9916 [Dactylellina haptotyla CBS 200.50]